MRGEIPIYSCNILYFLTPPIYHYMFGVLEFSWEAGEVIIVPLFKANGSYINADQITT